MPHVSVIVPAYGVASLLGDALSSLQAQTLTDWEAIVVDDGATDDVAAAVAPFATDPRIRLLQTENGGPAVARNRAIAAASASVVALLDGDDAYEPTYLDAMLAALARDARTGFVTCDASYFGSPDRLGQRFSAFYAQTGAITVERVLLREFNVFIACLIRREALDAVNGFDETLSNAEDFDLWVRLLDAGWRGRVVPEPLVSYRRRKASRSADRTKLLDGEEQVYAHAAERLQTVSARDAAGKMLVRVRAEQQWLAGEKLILSGQARAGVDLLRDSGRRPGRWRIAVPLMNMVPALARPLLRMRGKLQR